MTPTDHPARLPEPRIHRFQRHAESALGRRFASYEELWHWSVTDLRGFWRLLWQHFDLQSPTPWQTELVEPVMPGAVWFPGAQVNYAQQVFRHVEACERAGHPALVFQNERLAEPVALGWAQLRQQAASLALRLQAMGVQPGDRVAAYLPNTPQAIVAFLACASVGATWSICSPDMGPVAVLDRFSQIEPRVLITVDGQQWGGIRHDRRAVLHTVLAGLPSVEHLVWVADLDPTAPGAPFARAGRQVHDWADLVSDPLPPGWAPRWLPFDHPLWIVYSSGTTGLPKPIVHGHGGVMLEALKGSLHNDVAPTLESGERFFWFSSTGWIMWNAQLGALLGGTTIALYDGNPAGVPEESGTPPDWTRLWRFAADASITWFGSGAAFYASCLKADVHPTRCGDLSRLRAIGSTGSPLSDEAYDWIWQRLPPVQGAPIWINVISGGTDFAGAFVAGHRGLPQVRGEMQCRCLGAAVHAFDEAGRPVLDAVGELVCTAPLPSMPLRFWNDENGRRLHDSYFDVFAGVWRHGDWIRLVSHPESGSVGAVIYGRSDTTINRHGVRMGTAELYRAVEALPQVMDSLVVDLEHLGRDSWMPLFVVLREGVALDAALEKTLRQAIREALSARHVPDAIFQVAGIPRTLSGKKMELPVKRLLLGAAPEQVLKRDAMANAECLDFFLALARKRNDPPLQA